MFVCADPSGSGEKPQASATANRRDALSLEVSLVKVNISRERSREFPHMNISLPHGSPMSPSISPAKTVINKFSSECFASVDLEIKFLKGFLVKALI